MSRWSLRGQNRGASLIAVLVALIFVATFGGIILNITMTNIRMREAEAASKRNFYSAEEILDEITVALNNEAASAMQNAYTNILADYRSIMQGGSNVQLEFSRMYMEELTKTFWNQDSSTWKDTKVTVSPLDVEQLIYVWGYYDTDTIINAWATVRGVTPDELRADPVCNYLVIDAADATFTADYEAGNFTLQNIRVDYIDDRGYRTTISTDMVFQTPSLNFDGSNKIMDYMRYALIADVSVDVNVNNVSVNGSIYAGHGGIILDHSQNVNIVGTNIVTRGDIDLQPGSTVTIGNGASRIWAENIITSDLASAGVAGSASSLTLNGNCYVSDDLSINGQYSTVTLAGNYYGYNFLENYVDPVLAGNNADFSSAIMINGTHARLDMQGLNYLHLAGRTFISRGSNSSTNANKDILLGESLSVRTNQLAYYVPEQYLYITTQPGHPDIVTGAEFTAEGLAEYETYIGMTNISSYLDSTSPVDIYRFNDNGRLSYRYYLNFAGEQEANNFFAAYWTANASRLSAYGDSYADAILLDDSTLYTLKGDILKKNGTSFEQMQVVIDPSGDGRWQPDGIYYTYADRLAVNYMALQMYLTDNHKDIDSNKIHFYNASGAIDKSVDPLLSNLLDMDALRAISGTITATNDEEGARIVLTNNGSTPYQVYSGKGIVIATGDVQVMQDFTGMIISGGTITFATNASVTADELLVSRMFSADAALGESSVFTQFFTEYGSLAESVIGTVQIDKYLKYENWTRTEE